MDICNDSSFLLNCDWYSVYLVSIFDVDFHDISNLWDNNMEDCELLDVVTTIEKYSPVVEDISLEDDVLYSAVEQIESE